MAEAFCCQLFEKVVVAKLSPPYTRTDARLTSTERTRLTASFKRTWDIIETYRNRRWTVDDAFANLSTEDHFLTLEMFKFLSQTITVAQLGQLVLLQYGDKRLFREVNEGNGLLDYFDRCRTSMNSRLGCLGYQTPPNAPLGYFGVFDHWQQGFMEQLDPNYSPYDATAEDLCCDYFEAIVVPRLVRPHSRENPGLTPTERLRLSEAFRKTWNIIVSYQKGLEDAKRNFMDLSAKEVIRTFEVIVFLHTNIDDARLRRITRLKQGDERLFDELKGSEGMKVILRLCNEEMKRKLPRGYDRPSKIPLGFFAMFDHWQEEYMEHLQPGTDVGKMPDQLCCDLFEETVVDKLGPPHRRPDPHLNPTERARLMSSFRLAWALIKVHRDCRENAESVLVNLQAKDLFLTVEMFKFLSETINETQFVRLLQLQRRGKESLKYVDGRRGLTELYNLSYEVMAERPGYRGYNLPSRVPLMYFGAFDHWHEDYTEHWEPGISVRCQQN